jgi:hypothetical protein
MAASSKDKRTPIITPPYQVPSADVTPDPSTFSLDTTFKGLTELVQNFAYSVECIKGTRALLVILIWFGSRIAVGKMWVFYKFK